MSEGAQPRALEWCHGANLELSGLVEEKSTCLKRFSFFSHCCERIGFGLNCFVPVCVFINDWQFLSTSAERNEAFHTNLVGHVACPHWQVLHRWALHSKFVRCPFFSLAFVVHIFTTKEFESFVGYTRAWASVTRPFWPEPAWAFLAAQSFSQLNLEVC